MMVSEAAEVERKLMRENTIIAPMFFSLRAQGKTNYLLLTNHAVAAQEFPPQVFEYIHKCTTFVTEESDEDARQFYREAIFRPARSKPWISELSSEAVTFLETAIYKTFDNIGLSHIPIDKLRIWATYFFADYGYRLMVSEILSAEAEAEAETQSQTESVVENHLPSMDIHLMQYFGQKNIRGLETLCSRIPEHIKNGNSVESLRELYNRANETITFLKNKQDYDSEMEEGDSEDEDATEHYQHYITAYRNAEHLSNPQYAIEQNEDEETIIRNWRWLSNFQKLHQQLEGPTLFGVGARHAVGEWGLLSLLPKLGFEIKRLVPDSTFVDFVYPFQSQIASSLPLSHERLIKGCSREFNASLLYQFKGCTKQKLKAIGVERSFSMPKNIILGCRLVEEGMYALEMSVSDSIWIRDLLEKMSVFGVWTRPYAPTYCTQHAVLLSAKELNTILKVVPDMQAILESLDILPPHSAKRLGV